MWRINNFLLLIFLIFALSVGGYVFFQDYLSYLDWGENAREEESRTLNSGEETDDEGRRLRTHAVSFDTVIEHDEWGPWSIVLAGQTAATKAIINSEDTIIVTGSRKGSSGLVEYVRPFYARFTNNLVLRDSSNAAERPLFTEKVAITNILTLPNEQNPGLVAAYIDADTNGDGKIDENDSKKLRLFRFQHDGFIDMSFDGVFVAFNAYEQGSAKFEFTTYLDLNENGEIDRNFEPVRLYEASVETGTVHKALSDETISNLQSILDGPVN